MKAPRSPNPIGKLSRVQPKLEQLLPHAEQRLAFEEASAALEAGQLVRAARINAGLVVRSKDLIPRSALLAPVSG